MMRQTLQQNKMNHRHWAKDVIKCCLSSAYSPAREQEQLSRQRVRVLKRGAGFINKQSSCVHRAKLRRASCHCCLKVVNTFEIKDPYVYLMSILPNYLATLFRDPCTPPSLKGSQSTAHNPRRHLKCSVIGFLFCFYFS